MGALNLLKYKDACFFLIEPNSPPANVQGHNTSSTSIWVGWDTVPVADQNGITLSYTVTYKLVPDGSPQTVRGAGSNHTSEFDRFDEIQEVLHNGVCL